MSVVSRFAYLRIDDWTVIFLYPAVEKINIHSMVENVNADECVQRFELEFDTQQMNGFNDEKECDSIRAVSK